MTLKCKAAVGTGDPTVGLTACVETERRQAGGTISMIQSAGPLVALVSANLKTVFILRPVYYHRTQQKGPDS